MAKLARAATIAAAALGVVVLAALFVSVLVNLRDPEISAQARSMAHFKPRPIVDESNAYVALLGFSAPLRTDPIAEGKRLAAEHDTALSADPFARQRRPDQAPEPDSDQDDRIALTGDLDAACDILSEPCMPFALAREPVVRALVSANRVLIDRYENARRLPGFVAVPIADHGRAAIERSHLDRVHAILLTSAALDAQQGRAAAACGFLESDGVFWRRMLSGAGTLGDKLPAFRALGEDVRLASELIASPVFDAASCGPALRTLLAPMTRKEASLADAFRMAYVSTVRMLASWPDPAISVEPESWVDRHLKETPLYDLYYCRNATINRSAQLYADLAVLAAQPPANFVAARDAFLSDYRDLGSIGPGWFYNPLGKMLLGRHLPLHVDYVAHAHGVAAYVDLVRTQLDLRVAAIPLAQVPRFLERAGPDSANPIDRLPFHWDGARRSLSFDPLDRRWRRWGTSVTIAEP